MSLQDNILKIIKDEIDNDPEGLGYKGKTSEEITKLMNNPYTKQRIVEDGFTARINTILVGIANTPNVVTEQEVIDAGDVLGFNVDSCTTITRTTLSLNVTKT